MLFPLSLRAIADGAAIQSIMHARMRDFIMTGSPRSQCSLAMTKSTTPSSPLWRGAAQRRGGQRTQECTTHLSLRAIADGVAIQ